MVKSFFVRSKQIDAAMRENLKNFISKNSSLIYSEKKYDYLFILGGDGAFLWNVYEYIIKPKLWNVIVIAINTGRIGFYMQFSNTEEDMKEIVSNIAVITPRYIFKIPSYEVEITTENEFFTDYFINDLAFFSLAKAVTMSVYLNKDLSAKGRSRKTFNLLFKLRGSGYLISSALGNFALMQSIGGPLFVQKSNHLTLKPLFSINNKKEHAVNNSFIFGASNKLSIKTDTSEMAEASESQKIKKSKQTKEHIGFYCGSLAIDGQREYIAVKNIKITGKNYEIKLLKKRSLQQIWQKLFHKVI